MPPRKINNKVFSSEYISALEKLPVALVIFDNKTVYYLNKKAIEILKIPKTQSAEFKNLKPLAFIAPEFQKRIKENNLRIIKGEEFPPIELKIINTKGKLIDVEAKSNAIDFNGKKVVQSTFHEISERKKLHEELVESQSLLDLINKNNSDIIFKYDFYPKEKYVYVSDSVKTVLGYSPNDYYKDKTFYLKVIHPADKKNILKSKKAQALAKENSSTVRYIKKDGSTVWIQTDYSYIKDKKGKLISMLGICRDISELRRKEEEIGQKWSNYRELLNESPSAFFIHRGGFCLMTNKAAAKLLKAKSEESLIGEFLIDYIVPEQRARAIDRLKQATAGTEFDFLNYQITNKKGEIVDIELKTVPVKFNGEPAVLTIMNDIGSKLVYEKEKLRAEIAEEHNKELIFEIENRNRIEAKLSAIFESSSHLVWTINDKCEVTYFNQNYFNIFKNKYGVEPEIGKTLFGLVPKDQRDEFKTFWNPKFDQVLNGKSLIFERKEEFQNGEEVFREVYLNPIKNEKGIIYEIACLAHDISENKRNEQQILDQSLRLKAIFESGSQLMWTVNKNICFTSFNTNFANAIHELYGVYPQLNKDFDQLNVKVDTYVYHNYWNSKYAAVFKGETQEFMTERVGANGRKTYRQMFLHPIFNKDNEVVEVSGMGFDITEKVEYENKITNQSAKLNAIFNGSSHYIWTVDNNNRLTSFNKNYSNLVKDLYDIYPEEGLSLNRGKMIEDKEYNLWWDEQYELALSGKAHNFEMAIKDLKGNKIYLEVFLNPVFDQENNVVEISGIAHNITEKNLNQEKITQSLNEKEVLLKEVHHRVKNNMQVISSILNLQSSYVKDEYALGLLKESQNRIKTMAYIHESLYQNKTFTSINFSDYVSTLTNNILQSYAASIQKVRLVLDVQKVILNLDTSIPAGLIINELVTNSIKHAFTDVNDGIILINLYTKNNSLFLEVSDNGKGFPEDIDFKNTNSLGLQLVNTLIEQLNGSIELKENKYKGTSFFINFPM